MKTSSIVFIRREPHGLGNGFNEGGTDYRVTPNGADILEVCEVIGRRGLHYVRHLTPWLGTRWHSI